MQIQDKNVQLWTAIRQALLMIVDAIERFMLEWPHEQRTAELRKTAKR